MNNRQLRFVNYATRKPLSAKEVNYWKLNLSRILKIGAEFEFNLPDKPTGTCKGRSFTCPCVKYGIDEFDCWKTCLRTEECKSTAHPSRCENFENNKCNNTICAICKDYKFSCNGELCSNIISSCNICKDFTLNCLNCIYRFDPNKNPDAIRQSCINTLNPSGSYGIINKSGVHNIVTDGSLLGKSGMEIITTGRRVDYWEFFTMAENIINTSVSKGAYINERCSIHMHGLASYYGKIPGTGSSGNKINEMERSMPEIILANLHQLFRRYQNAITWMTSGLDDPNKLTRWEKFRVSILGISAIPHNMRAVKDLVSNNSGGNKYGWANYKFCEFDGQGDVSRLHVEVRVMDGLLSPSAVAAIACLYYALFIKAVELSRYGVMEVGDDDWEKESTTIKKTLMNNCSDWQEGTKYGRFSDTSNLHKYTETLVRESFDLIAQVKHIVSSIGPAYEVLEKLAETPCSIRRCEGASWENIENTLKVELTQEGKFDYEISKIIDTREIVGATNEHHWFSLVAAAISENKELNPEKVSKGELEDKIVLYIKDKQNNGDMIWASKIGSIISI